MKRLEKNRDKRVRTDDSNKPRVSTVLLLAVSIGLIFALVATLIILRMAAITTAQGNDAAHQVASVAANLQQACGEGGRIGILEIFLRNIVDHEILQEIRMHRAPAAARDIGDRESDKPPDSLEREVLDDGRMRRVVDKQAHTVRYVYANLAEESCISRCHVSAKPGEVLGVASVTVDTKKIDNARFRLNVLLVIVVVVAGLAEIMFVVILLTKENTDRSIRLLRKTRKDLEAKVQERTSELTSLNDLLKRDISKRKLLEQDRRRLERELVGIVERERQRTGRVLHDSIGQQLTGISCMMQVLEERLSGSSLADEASYVEKISTQVNKAVEQTRLLAKGLDPIDLETNGLNLELEKLANHMQSVSGVACKLEWGQAVSVEDPSVSVNLFRIAQEAITNAIRHGRPKYIKVSLTRENGHGKLTVTNDGLGFPEDAAKRGGMGLSIMRHRAEMINGSLGIRRRVDGGTIVTCTFPNKN